MRKEFKKVNGKKPRCPCGHLLERHSKFGACEAGAGRVGSCPCTNGPTGDKRRELARKGKGA